MRTRSSPLLSRTAVLLLSLLLPAGLVAAPAPAAPARATVTARSTPLLVAVRAAHHPGFDRLVLQFAGGLPSQRSVSYVPRVTADPSGLPVRLAGNAFLQITLSPATNHTESGKAGYPVTRQAFALPQIIEVAQAGDFEAVLSFGVGLSKRTHVRVTTLRRPSRVVVDISTPFPRVRERVWFLDRARFDAGRPPYVRAVSRPVATPAVAKGVLQRLFAGPTQVEKRVRHLRLVRSGATGFADLRIRGGIARVRLTGGCSSGGSTFTIADEIFPTLKQFRSVRWVKIYDPAGRTERPTGRSDSIPECLEP